MSRKFLPMLLAVALVAMGFSFAANADVDGEFDVFIVMTPETISGESTFMIFDFETVLDLTVTISGLSMNHDLAFGVGGVEHYIATLQATLGALDIKDEFAFATPYYGVSSGIKTSYGGVKRGKLLFVKKRVESEISLGGVTFNNLFMLEDVTFPEPSDTDPGVAYQTQHFAVGDIIAIQGETPSGVFVEGATFLCADAFLYKLYPKHQLMKIFEYDFNNIKKKSWDQVVEPDCYGFGPTVQAAPQELFKPAFAFTKEIINIANIPFPSGITVDTVGVFSSVPYKLSTFPWNANFAFSFIRGTRASRALLGVNNDGDVWVDENGNGVFDGGIDEVWFDVNADGLVDAGDTNLYPGLDGVAAPIGAAYAGALIDEDPTDLIDNDRDGVIDEDPAELRPVRIPFFIDTVIQIPVAGLADLLIELWTDDIDSIWIDKMVVTFQLPEHGWSIHWYDLDGDLTLTVNDRVDFKGGLSFQDAVSLSFFLELVPTIGPVLLDVDLELPISWPEPYGSLAFDFDWVAGLTGELMFDDWTFELTKEWAHNEFQIAATFDKYAFVEADVNVKVTFDI